MGQETDIGPASLDHLGPTASSICGGQLAGECHGCANCVPLKASSRADPPGASNSASALVAPMSFSERSFDL
jgi:hypothetical protein